MKIIKEGKAPLFEFNDELELYFICDTCKTEFIAKDSEFAYGERHINGDRWFKCPVCNTAINKRHGKVLPKESEEEINQR